MNEPILKSINWKCLSTRVVSEQRNREVHTPPISVFRWWARRPHRLIGAILDAATVGQPEIFVSDPFSGGGTVALEAARRGLGVYAQDLHPWATTGLLTALDGVDPHALSSAGSQLLADLQPLRRSLYGAPCPTHGKGSETLATFWVGTAVCERCSVVTYLFPYSLVTLASRARDKDAAFFGCRCCGAVSARLTNRTDIRCSVCRHRFAPPDEPLLYDRRAACWSCGHELAVFEGEIVRREPVLVQRLCATNGRQLLHFGSPLPRDLALAQTDRPVTPMPLHRAIPDGLETSILRRAGFRRWLDLYPPRQLEVLVSAASVVDQLDITHGVRRRLRLAISGAAEMAGMASRWDRYYPKPFEVMSNHRYSSTGLSVEMNLLSERGRGTLPRRLRSSERAARWALETVQRPALPSRTRAQKIPAGNLVGTVVACGSSERQLLPTNSVDLVLTDPPYFDDVQYAELASLFTVWAEAVGLLANRVAVDVCREAVPNPRRGTGAAEYQAVLTGVFTEVARTLKPAGRLVLTFHNTDLRAWFALAEALRSAELDVVALAVCASENPDDHSKRGRRSFRNDLVIECGSRPPRRSPLIVTPPRTDETRELVAAGTAMALRAHSYGEFRAAFRAERGEIDLPRIRD